MTEVEFKESVKDFLRDERGKQSFDKFIGEFQEFIEAAKKYDPILAEHLNQVFTDMKRIESYVQTFYKLS